MNMKKALTRIKELRAEETAILEAMKNEHGMWACKPGNTVILVQGIEVIEKALNVEGVPIHSVLSDGKLYNAKRIHWCGVEVSQLGIVGPEGEITYRMAEEEEK